jgi:hypothetical protein
MRSFFKKIFLISLSVLIGLALLEQTPLKAQQQGGFDQRGGSIQTSVSNSFEVLTPKVMKQRDSLTQKQLLNLSERELLKRYQIDDPLYLQCWLEVTESLKISRADTLESLEHYLNVKTAQAIKEKREKLQVPTYGVLDSYTDTLVNILTHFNAKSPNEAFMWFGSHMQNLIQLSYARFQKLVDHICVKKYHVFVLV